MHENGSMQIGFSVFYLQKAPLFLPNKIKYYQYQNIHDFSSFFALLNQFLFG